MKKVALYVRVSTQEQKKHGLSVDNQIVALNDWCSENGYEVVDVYNDAGLTASKSYKSRPELLRMLKDCQAGKIDLVLFTRLDRFFRSVADYYACVEQMAGVPWKTIWEDYETETSAGVFKVNIMLSIAQAEATRTSEKIQSVFEYKRARGDYIGTAPTGYKKLNNNLIIDKEKEAGVRAFFQAFLDYKPTKECADAARVHGVVVSRTTAYYMLRNRAYAGLCENGFKCEPYITMAQYEAIQERVRQKNRQSIVTTYLFQGMCKCGICGRAMVASPHRMHSKKKGDYIKNSYQCHGRYDNYIHKQCLGVAIVENRLERLLLESLDERIVEYNKSLIEVPVQETDYGKQIKALEDKLARVGIRYEDGDISTDEYREKRNAITKEIASLRSNLEPHEAIELPDDWHEMYADLTQENKAVFWHRIIKEITVNPGKTIDIIFL